MAIIKCKMCGGDLELTEGMSVAVCEYCGTQQTVPTADSEKKLTLFARANRLRAACEFDKAAGVYESIVAEFPEEAEAYWGLVLCRYGIEYVDDPATGKKIPTCHRSSFDSILEDSDFEQACENADVVARKVYREEAKAIEDIRKGILEVSGKEEPYDIFICYKETDENGERTVDSVIAQDVYDALTEKGYRVFFSRITLEDKLGTEYEPYIFAALNSAKIMLAFGTDYERFNAVWVKNEWSRFLALIAAGQKKFLIPCYKGVDAYDMPKEFAKLQAQDMGKVGATQDLLRGIDKIMGKGSQPAVPAKEPVVVQQAGGPTVEALLKRGYLALEDGDWEKAKELFDQVLSIVPESAEAYLGMAMGNHQDTTREICKRSVLAGKYDGDKNLRRAQQFAAGAFKNWMDELMEQSAAYTAQKEAEAETIKQSMARMHELRTAVNLLSAGSNYLVGLKLDGTLVATGNNDYGQCDISGWESIVAVSVGDAHTVGLRADGTVVATGANEYGQCDVSGWRDIVAISAGGDHTIGLRVDGTVVATGDNNYRQCSVSGWRDIVAISAGGARTVGIRANGTVVIRGRVSYGEGNAFGWNDAVIVSVSSTNLVGLRADGSVMATGNNDCGQCKVSSWRDIVAISAGDGHTVGLQADGTVVAIGDNKNGQCNVSAWRNIVAISAGEGYTVGLQIDGTVVTAGTNSEGQCNVSDWKLVNSLNELEDWTVKAKARKDEGYRRMEQEKHRFQEEQRRRQEEQRRLREEERCLQEKELAEKRIRQIAVLTKEKASLQTERANLKGLFVSKRRKEIETRLSEIEAELNTP